MYKLNSDEGGTNLKHHHSYRSAQRLRELATPVAMAGHLGRAFLVEEFSRSLHLSITHQPKHDFHNHRHGTAQMAGSRNGTPEETTLSPWRCSKV